MIKSALANTRHGSANEGAETKESGKDYLAADVAAVLRRPLRSTEFVMLLHL